MCPMKDVVHGHWGKKFDKIADALTDSITFPS
jgi:hypothetical protein